MVLMLPRSTQKHWISTRSFLGLKEFERSGAATFVNGFWAGNEVPIVHVVTDAAEGPLEMPNNTHISLFVADIDTAVVKVKDYTDDFLHVGEGSQQIIGFKDPAGNTVELQLDPQYAFRVG